MSSTKTTETIVDCTTPERNANKRICRASVPRVTGQCRMTSGKLKAAFRPHKKAMLHLIVKKKQLVKKDRAANVHATTDELHKCERD